MQRLTPTRVLHPALSFCRLGAQQTWTLLGISPSQEPSASASFQAALFPDCLEKMSREGKEDSSEVSEGAEFLFSF